MTILVVGSVGLDDLETPLGTRRNVLGGACAYFATAASLYTNVGMVAVVGQDFPQEYVDFFASRNIDLRGLQIAPGKTFRWAGRYEKSMGDAITLDTQLNVFADFHPQIPDDLRDSPFVFLANIDPDLQIEVLQQMRAPRLTALDSMNYWMAHKRASLTRAMSMVDIVLLNESEVRLYAGDENLLAAARTVLDLGPRALVIKRGEHGSLLLVHGDGQELGLFVAPAYPVDPVVDPTGAGDSFAAGLMGYLAHSRDLSLGGLRRAMAHGSVVASFTVQGFGTERLQTLTLSDIEQRYRALCALSYFDRMPDTLLDVLKTTIK